MKLNRWHLYPTTDDPPQSDQPRQHVNFIPAASYPSVKLIRSTPFTLYQDPKAMMNDALQEEIRMVSVKAGLVRYQATVIRVSSQGVTRDLWDTRYIVTALITYGHLPIKEVHPQRGSTKVRYLDA